MFLPGNLSNFVGTPQDSRRVCRREVCVVLPERSRPSTTMNAARFVVVILGGSGSVVCRAYPTFDPIVNGSACRAHVI